MGKTLDLLMIVKAQFQCVFFQFCYVHVLHSKISETEMRFTTS